MHACIPRVQYSAWAVLHDCCCGCWLTKIEIPNPGNDNGIRMKLWISQYCIFVDDDAGGAITRHCSRTLPLTPERGSERRITIFVFNVFLCHCKVYACSHNRISKCGRESYHYYKYILVRAAFGSWKVKAKLVKAAGGGKCLCTCKTAL